MTTRFPPLDAVARKIVASTMELPPTLGAGRLICVDGPAGAGKTSLGSALDRAARDASRPPDAGRARVGLVHMDDVYEGWTGLSVGMEAVARDVVEPLRAGRAGRYRRYDWHRAARAEERVVDPVDVLVVEGVGSGNLAYADAITVLVWVDTPVDLRLRRGIERDGEEQRDHWLAWRELEDGMFAEHRTRERADVVVDGQSGRTMK